MRYDTGLRILHYARCGTLGGVENLLARLIGTPSRNISVEHHLLVRSSRIHPYVRGMLQCGAASLGYVTSWRGTRIPAWPPQLIPGHIGRAARKIAPDVILVWNCLGDRHLIWADLRGAPVIYYDHAATWYAPDGDAQRRFLARVDAAICCSHAGRRMLQLRWDFNKPVSVCLNGVSAASITGGATPRRRPPGSTLRLGLAARLTPVKGISLAIHALAELRRQGRDCRLDIAGSGDEEQRLRTLCQHLNVSGQVFFHGLVRDISRFLKGIDLFLSPSLMDPFPLACIEAGAHGVPVVASNVDGLPEMVIDGVTGVLVDPSLPLRDYAELGGTLEQLPAVVYDPATDTLMHPRLVDPAKLAGVIARLMDDPDRLWQMGANARARAAEHFSSARYVQCLLSQLTRLAREPATKPAAPGSGT